MKNIVLLALCACTMHALWAQNSTYRFLARISAAGNVYLPTLPQQSPVQQMGYGALLGGAVYCGKPLALDINAGVTPAAKYPETDSTRASYLLAEANTQLRLDLIKLFAAETVPVSLYIGGGIGVASISGKTAPYAPATVGFRFGLGKKADFRVEGTYKYGLGKNTPAIAAVNAGFAFSVTQPKKPKEKTVAPPPAKATAKTNTFNTGDINKATAENAATKPATNAPKGNATPAAANDTSQPVASQPVAPKSTTTSASTTKPSAPTAATTPAPKNGAANTAPTSSAAKPAGAASASNNAPSSAKNTAGTAPKSSAQTASPEEEELSHTENATISTGEATEEEELLTRPSQGETTVGTFARNVSREDSIFLEEASFLIQFAEGSDQLLPDCYPTLDKIAALMAKYPKAKLHVSGHCDEMDMPTREELLILSVKRAYNVKYYLVNQKLVRLSRITSDGYGADMPLKGKSNKPNARVEFDLFNK